MKRSRTGALATLISAMLVMVVACNRSPDPTARESAEATTTATKDSGIHAPAAPEKVVAAADRPTIVIGTWEEAQQWVAQNPGKVVILDLWTSW